MHRTRLFGHVLSAIAFALATASLHAAPNTKLRIPAHARVGDARLADVQFEFTCTTGKGGALSIAAVLPTPEAVPGFPLERFEGPEGIGEAGKLATWSVLGKRAMQANGAISGWRGVDGDGFLLASSRDSGRETDLGRLLKRWLLETGQPLWLEVRAPGGNAKLSVTALADARIAQLSLVLSPCLTQSRP
jgi:hypothetical protein